MKRSGFTKIYRFIACHSTHERRLSSGFVVALAVLMGVFLLPACTDIASAKTRADDIIDSEYIADGTDALMNVKEDPLADGSDDSKNTRDIRLHKHANVIPAEYDRQYFYVGDHGLLTFSAETSSARLPGAPDKAKEEYLNMTEGDAFADTTITYSVTDPEVLTIDQQHHIYRILSGGEATVILTAKVQVPDSSSPTGYTDETWLAKFTFIVLGDTRGTKLSRDHITTYIISDSVGEADIQLVDCPDLRYYVFDYRSSNTDMLVSAELDSISKTIHVSSAVPGTTVLTFKLNSTSFILTLDNVVTDINMDHHVMDVDDNVQLELSGFKGKCKWISTAPDVAKVGRDGVVYGLKPGNSIVYAKVGTGEDARKLGCAVSVVEKGHTMVVNKAIEIGATRSYSQPMRMQPGYYDCSSLVWMAYSQIGRYFGIKKYAPTAASECQWCDRHNRILGEWTWEDFNAMKYLPGDVLFRVGAENERFLGIYHVEMFAGYKVVSFDGDEPELAMLWANRPDNYYEPCGDLMARP